MCRRLQFATRTGFATSRANLFNSSTYVFPEIGFRSAFREFAAAVSRTRKNEPSANRRDCPKIQARDPASTSFCLCRFLRSGGPADGDAGSNHRRTGRHYSPAIQGKPPPARDRKRTENSISRGAAPVARQSCSTPVSPGASSVSPGSIRFERFANPVISGKTGGPGKTRSRPAQDPEKKPVPPTCRNDRSV
jgi:hypothetical protein